MSDLNDKETAGLRKGQLHKMSLYWCTHEPWLYNSEERNYWMSVHGGKVWKVRSHFKRPDWHGRVAGTLMRQPAGSYGYHSEVVIVKEV